MIWYYCDNELVELKYFLLSYRLYQERCTDPIGRWNGLHRGSGDLSQRKLQIIYLITFYYLGKTRDNLSLMHFIVLTHFIENNFFLSVTFGLLGLYCSRSQPALHQGSTRGHSDQNVRRKWELSLDVSFLMKMLKPEESFGPPPGVQPSSLSFCKSSVKYHLLSGLAQV